MKKVIPVLCFGSGLYGTFLQHKYPRQPFLHTKFSTFHYKLGAFFFYSNPLFLSTYLIQKYVNNN